MVWVTVNGERRELSAETPLLTFLADLRIDERRIAIAHNGTVLHREDWRSVTLKNGDRVEIVRMIGGGAT